MFRNPLSLSQGQKLQIWYGQDFADCGESDNSGTTCVDVYAWYRPDPWQKINTDPICFGARDDSYGAFSIPSTGHVKAMKLVYKSGSIKCNTVYGDSYWGCNNPTFYTRKDLMTIITDTNRDALLPPAEDLQSFPGHICGKKHYYTLEGTEQKSAELVFRNPLSLSQGQKLQIWYGQDFADCGESDNSGTTCVDAHAWYIQTSM